MKSNRQLQFMKIKIIGSEKDDDSLLVRQTCIENNWQYNWVDSVENSEVLKIFQENFKYYKIPIIMLNDEYLGGVQEFKNFTQKIQYSEKYTGKLGQNENKPYQKHSELSMDEKKFQRQHMLQLTEYNINLYKIKMREKSYSAYVQQLSRFQKDRKALQKEICNGNETWFGEKKIHYFTKNHFVTYYDNLCQLKEKETDVLFSSDSLENSNSIFDCKKDQQFTIQNFVNQFQEPPLQKDKSKNQKLKQDNQFQYHIPIVVVSGFPTYIYEWKKFQENLGENFCRILNFVIPGFDKIDERRGGSYRGDIENICVLLKNLLNVLNINKIVLVCHSVGHFICDKYIDMYPNMVAGVSYMGAMGRFPQQYIESSYKLLLKLFNTSHKKLPQNLDEIYQEINIQQNRDYIRSQITDEDFINRSVPELMAMIKIYISYSNGLEGLYETIRKPKKNILKFICSGDNDEYFEHHEYELSGFLYYNTEVDIKKQNFQLKSHEKDYITKKIESKAYSIDMNQFSWENLQKNFSFFLYNTGHAVQRQRCEEILQPFMSYICVINCLEELSQQQAKL